MLNGMTVLRFENMPELARSGGKKTAQCTHCALKHLPHAPDGRQAVHTVGRPAMPSFASLNLVGSPPSPPPRPPPPPPPSPALRTNPKLKVLHPRNIFKHGWVTFNKLPFSERIAMMSTRVGAERSLWPGIPTRTPTPLRQSSPR